MQRGQKKTSLDFLWQNPIAQLYVITIFQDTVLSCE